MTNTYADLQQYTYAGLENFTYQQLAGPSGPVPADPRIVGVFTYPFTWPVGASGTVSMTVPANALQGTLSFNANVFVCQTTGDATHTMVSTTGLTMLSNAVPSFPTGATNHLNCGSVNDDAVQNGQPYQWIGYFSQTRLGSGATVLGVDANAVASGGTIQFVSPGAPSYITQQMNISGLITFVYVENTAGGPPNGTVASCAIDAAHSTPGATIGGGFNGGIAISAISATATVMWQVSNAGGGFGNTGLAFGALGTQGASLSVTADPLWVVLANTVQPAWNDVPVVQQIILCLTLQWNSAGSSYGTPVPVFTASVSPSAAWDASVFVVGMLPLPGPLPPPTVTGVGQVSIVG